jgi:hypothetical protein
VPLWLAIATVECRVDVAERRRRIFHAPGLHISSAKGNKDFSAVRDIRLVRKGVSVGVGRWIFDTALFL